MREISVSSVHLLLKDRRQALALDPLGPIAPRPRRIPNAAWPVGSLSLDPLSPLCPPRGDHRATRYSPGREQATGYSPGREQAPVGGEVTT